MLNFGVSIKLNSVKTVDKLNKTNLTQEMLLLTDGLKVLSLN